MGNCPCECKNTIQKKEDLNIKHNSSIIHNEKEKKLEFVHSFTKYSKATTANSSLSSSPKGARKTSILVDPSLHIVIYGSPYTGKSTFGLKLTKKKVTNYYIPSLYTEVFRTHVIQNNQFFNLILTVPKPTEHWGVLDANCYFIFFDLSNRETFLESQKILCEKLKNHNRPKFLIGNKCDKRASITNEEIMNFVNKEKCYYFEISAFMGLGLINLMKITEKSLIQQRSEDSSKNKK